MSSKGVLPMDSYRLAQYSVQVPCFICDGGNSFDAEVCRHCQAPMALAHQANLRKTPPQLVAAIGSADAGKTVYLGMLLDMLSKRADDFDAVPKGAYSVDLQHSVVSHLAARHFPPKTAMEADQWNWAYYQVSRRTRGARIHDLVMPDMAGEAIAAEVAAPRTFTVIRSLLEKSAGAILLVDAALAAAGSPQPDFFALKLMSYLDGLLATKGQERMKTPVAIILSKGDYCPECFDDPRGFAKTNLNRLWNICENRFEKVEFFATSVVGALAYGTDASDNVIPYPLHVAPRGVMEPFEWVLSALGQ